MPEIMEFLQNPTYETLIKFLAYIFISIFGVLKACEGKISTGLFYKFCNANIITQIVIASVVTVVSAIVGYFYINSDTIEGKVLFYDNKSPVVGVKVILLKTNEETITNEKGEYTFRWVALGNTKTLRFDILYPDYEILNESHRQQWNEDGNDLYLIKKEQVDENY